MSTETDQTEAVRAFIEQVVGQGDVETVREFFSDKSNPVVERVQNAVRRLHSTVPDVEVTIERVIAQPDEVVVFHSIHGRPSKEFGAGIEELDIGAVALFELDGTKLSGVSGYLN